MALGTMRLDFAELATDVVVAGGSGALQRLLWDNPNNLMGWLGTGAAIVGGYLLRGMSSSNSMMGRAGDAAYLSGLAIAGWVTTDMLFLGKRGIPAYTPQQQQMYAPRYSGQVPTPAEARLQSQLSAGKNGGPPGAMYQGMNPMTGEQILSSKI